MRGKFFATIMLLAGARLATVAVPAMSENGAAPPRRCEVANAARLPAASGGAQAICSAIERAVAAASPTAQYSAKVTVQSSSRLSAVLVVEGRSLPEQNFAVMDRDLNPSSIGHFAEALAREVAKAAKE